MMMPSMVEKGEDRLGMKRKMRSAAAGRGDFVGRRLGRRPMVDENELLKELFLRWSRCLQPRTLYKYRQNFKSKHLRAGQLLAAEEDR